MKTNTAVILFFKIVPPSNLYQRYVFSLKAKNGYKKAIPFCTSNYNKVNVTYSIKWDNALLSGIMHK